MFGLHSDLDQDKWDECTEEPPENKKKWEGYTPYNISRSDESKKEMIKYFLTNNSGEPVQGLLFGASRNPLKSVGHCYMSIIERKQGNVITAIAVEDDWVKMKPEYLATFGEKTEEDRKEEEAKLAEKIKDIDLGIFSDLDKSVWQKKGDVPRMKGNLGYSYYDISHAKDGDKNEYTIYMTAQNGTQVSSKLTSAPRNPLRTVGNGYFKIVDGCIKGMMIAEEWAEMKA